MSLFRTTSNGLLLIFAGCFLSCRQSSDEYQNLVEGTISYPFADRTQPIGKDPSGDRFVIRSIRGGSEYVVEIPHAAEDYDISIPMSGLPGADPKAKVQDPQLTDRELLSSMPRPTQDQERDRALLDDASGVGAKEESEQGPSYSMGLAKVVQYYKAREYEYALIEVNQLLAFYPNAARLYKMKGTILLKTNELALAEKAWRRASELDPQDRGIQKGLERLHNRLEQQQKSSPKSGAALRNTKPPLALKVRRPLRSSAWDEEPHSDR
jgi:tetratricopeptide (TPR) repeat protein